MHCPECHAVIIFSRDQQHAQCPTCRAEYDLYVKQTSGPKNGLKLEPGRFVPVKG